MRIRILSSFRVSSFEFRIYSPVAVLYPLSSILFFLHAGCVSTDTGARTNQFRKHPPEVSAIDFYGTELKFACTFTNSTARPVRLLSYVWELHVEGQRVDRGQGRAPRTIAAGTDFTLELPVVIKRSVLEKTLGRSPLPSELPYRFLGRANLGAGVRSWSFEFDEKGTLSILGSPSFSIQRFHVQEMDDAHARVAVEIRIHNPNSFPTKLSQFTADFILAGQTVAQSVTAPETEIAAHGTCVVPMNLDLHFKLLGQVVARALRNETAEYSLYGKAELSTPWGPKKVNYDTSGSLKIER